MTQGVRPPLTATTKRRRAPTASRASAAMMAAARRAAASAVVTISIFIRSSFAGVRAVGGGVEPLGEDGWANRPAAPALRTEVHRSRHGAPRGPRHPPTILP